MSSVTVTFDIPEKYDKDLAQAREDGDYGWVREILGYSDITDIL